MQILVSKGNTKKYHEDKTSWRELKCNAKKYSVYSKEG
jgi:hypothetical protein